MDKGKTSDGKRQRGRTAPIVDARDLPTFPRKDRRGVSESNLLTSDTTGIPSLDAVKALVSMQQYQKDIPHITKVEVNPKAVEEFEVFRCHELTVILLSHICVFIIVVAFI
eukprot:GHVR01129618.1.p1 GENE.GHVR01129618.1~~GHVR01129618.1.p1  ORF type:complete len:111 (+),score=25.46 GHVR01129618.1:101-433(+)